MVRRIFFLALAGVAVLLLASFAGSALAAEDGTKEIGLVITFPDGTEHLEVVTVPAAATMFDALKAAEIDLASADSDFGPAVCGIARAPCAHCTVSRVFSWREKPRRRAWSRRPARRWSGR